MMFIVHINIIYVKFIRHSVQLNYNCSINLTFYKNMIEKCKNTFIKYLHFYFVFFFQVLRDHVLDVANDLYKDFVKTWNDL